jgi:hypothetical protein
MPAVGIKTIIAGLVVWLALAIALGTTDVMSQLAPPWPQAVLLAIVALLGTAYFVVPSFRIGVDALPISWLIACHLVRNVGWYFLWLHRQGRLPGEFAIPAGIGDIMVANLAWLVVALRLPARSQRMWNFLGLADILFVVATVARLTLKDRNSMIELLHPPLSILPTFIVPLIIFTHVVIAVRLSRAR